MTGDSKVDVVVIGAGLTGVSAASDVAKSGASVVVLESEGTVGGTTRSEEVDGFICDTGLHFLGQNGMARLFDGHIARLEPGFEYLEGGRVAVATIDMRDTNNMFAVFNIFPFAGPEPWGELFRMVHPTGRLWNTDLFHRVVLPVYWTIARESTGHVSASIVNHAFWSYFQPGSPAIPGMGFSDPNFQFLRMAAALDIRLGARVTTIEPGSPYRVRFVGGVVDADVVIVATGPRTRAQLLHLDEPQPTGTLSSFWFAAQQPPSDSRRLRLGIAAPGRVFNSLIVSNVAPDRAPACQALIVASAIGGDAPVDETQVRADLAHVWGADTSGWRLLTRQDIQDAGMPTARPARIIRDAGHLIATAPQFTQEEALTEGAAASRVAVRALGLSHRIRPVNILRACLGRIPGP